MITCKICKKYARLTAAWKNGLDEIKIAGSCKHCGYEERTDYHNRGIPFTDIPPSNIDYDDYQELGFND